MPSSRYNVIPFVLDQVVKIQPKSILDIGVGYGKYGVLFREYLDIWKTDNKYGQHTFKLIGVEAFIGYKNPTWQLYDMVYTRDVKELLPVLKKTSFDLVFMGDVIEHFKKDEGRKILDELVYNHLIIVTPLNVYVQGKVYNNEYEVHQSAWKHQDFPNLECKLIENQQVFYG